MTVKKCDCNFSVKIKVLNFKIKIQYLSTGYDQHAPWSGCNVATLGQTEIFKMASKTAATTRDLSFNSKVHLEYLSLPKGGNITSAPWSVMVISRRQIIGEKKKLKPTIPG